MTAQSGDRVRLEVCTDQYTKLTPGATGTVTLIDASGTVFVKWDDGHTLGLVAEAGDGFTRIDPEDTP